MLNSVHKIFLQIKEFAKYRKLEVKDEQYYDKHKKKEEFIKHITIVNFIGVELKDMPTKKRHFDKRATSTHLKVITYVIVCLMDAVKTKERLYRLFRAIPTFKEKKYNKEIILVVPELTHAARRNIEDANDWSEGYRQIITIPHHQFIYNVPEHSHTINKPQILEPDECDILFNKHLHIEPDDLPVLLTTSPIVLWLGAVPGDIIKGYYYTPVCGKQLFYYIVKEPN